MLFKTRRVELDLSFGSIYFRVSAFGKLCAYHWDSAGLRAFDWMVADPLQQRR